MIVNVLRMSKKQNVAKHFAQNDAETTATKTFCFFVMRKTFTIIDFVGLQTFLL